MLVGVRFCEFIFILEAAKLIAVYGSPSVVFLLAVFLLIISIYDSFISV